MYILKVTTAMRVLVYVYLDHVSVCGAVDVTVADFEECHFMLAFLPYTCKDRDEDESDHSTDLSQGWLLHFDLKKMKLHSTL